MPDNCPSVLGQLQQFISCAQCLSWRPLHGSHDPFVVAKRSTLNVVDGASHLAHPEYKRPVVAFSDSCNSCEHLQSCTE